MAELSTSDVYIDFGEFNKGLYALRDTTKAPFGSARVMENVEVTDRGGVGPRPGIELIGSDTSGGPVNGLYEFETAYGNKGYLLRARDDKVELLVRGESTWHTIIDGLESDVEFDFARSIVNEDDQDLLIMSNRYDPFMSWNGAISKVQSTSSGNITVDSTLAPAQIEKDTATSSTTTTLTVSGQTWAANQFNDLYVHILTGGETGSVSQITDTTGDTITFNALPSDPGSAEFEIKQLKYKKNDKVIVDGTVYDYNDIDSSTVIKTNSGSVSYSDPAYAIQVPEEHEGNPRGSRIANYLSRITMGRVRSAVTKDSGGNDHGYATGSSVFVSKQKNPTDFSYSSPRVAGEGDLISMPHGGGDITDIVPQEDRFYVFKKRYIEAMQYSQDGNDTIIREPLKSNIGTTGRVINGTDDAYFVTSDNRITSIGRVAQKDIKPSTENIGRPIKRILDDFEFGDGKGIEYQDTLYIPAKSDPDFDENDVVIIYDLTEQTFEGIWTMNAGFFAERDEKLIFSESGNPNVFRAFAGNNDTIGNDTFGINAKYLSHFINVASNNGREQALNSLYFEGYILEGTEVKFQAYKDMEENPFFEYEFDGSVGTTEGEDTAALGGETIGINPKGAISSTDEDPRDHFFIRLYFPFQYGNTFAVGFESDGKDNDYELTRFGMGLKESVTFDADSVAKQ